LRSLDLVLCNYRFGFPWGRILDHHSVALDGGGS
jgi:hypothetical protein